MPVMLTRLIIYTKSKNNVCNFLLVYSVVLKTAQLGSEIEERKIPSLLFDENNTITNLILSLMRL